MDAGSGWHAAAQLGRTPIPEQDIDSGQRTVDAGTAVGRKAPRDVERVGCGGRSHRRILAGRIPSTRTRCTQDALRRHGAGRDELDERREGAMYRGLRVAAVVPALAHPETATVPASTTAAARPPTGMRTLRRMYSSKFPPRRDVGRSDHPG